MLHFVLYKLHRILGLKRAPAVGVLYFMFVLLSGGGRGESEIRRGGWENQGMKRGAAGSCICDGPKCNGCQNVQSQLGNLF